MPKGSYPEHILVRVREMTENTESDAAIQQMNPGKIFNFILEHEGIIGYDTWLKSRIRDIYGVDLDNL